MLALDYGISIYYVHGCEYVLSGNYHVILVLFITLRTHASIFLVKIELYNVIHCVESGCISYVVPS